MKRFLHALPLLLAACGDGGHGHTRLGQVQAFPWPHENGNGQLVWTGDELAYTSSTSFYRLNREGELLTEWPIAEQFSLALLHQGDRYTQFTQSMDSPVFVQQFDRSGSTGPPISLTPPVVVASAAWSGTEHLVSYGDESAYTFVMRFDASFGQLGRSELPFVPPTTVWHGSGYYGASGGLYKAIRWLELTAEGAPVAETIVLPGHTDPQIAWNGESLAIVGRSEGGESTFVRVDGTGQIIGDAVPLDGLSCCAPNTFRAVEGGYVVATIEDKPQLAWLGSEGQVLELSPVGSGHRSVVDAVVWTGSRVGLVYWLTTDAGTLDAMFQYVER